MSSPSNSFNQAVMAARAGERARALKLFLACVEQEGTNPRVWLWISALAEAKADQRSALEKARSLLPPESELHRKVTARIDILRAEPEPPAEIIPAHSLPFIEYPPQNETLKERFSRVKELRAAGKRAEAITLLEETARLHPESEKTWLALSHIYPDSLAKIGSLERALEINPRSAETARRLAMLRPMEKDPLKRGSFLQQQGELDLAVDVYRSVIALSRLPSKRLEAERRIQQIRLRQETDSIRKVSPTVTLLRLSSGPVLLFAMMVFMQSGLNPLHTPLLAFPGLFSVLAGSLIISASSMHPAHPMWLRLTGARSTGEEPEIQHGARLLGWALLFAPYTMFFIEASHRLGILQSSMLAR